MARGGGGGTSGDRKEGKILQRGIITKQDKRTAEDNAVAETDWEQVAHGEFINLKDGRPSAPNIPVEFVLVEESPARGTGKRCV